jgi:hypothetical protein
MSEPELTPHCPHCGSAFVRWTSPKAVNEYLLQFLHRVPLQCQICGHRFTVVHTESQKIGETPDRRHFDRIATRLPVTLVDESGAETSATITDLSLVGCQLHTSTPVVPGASLCVVLSSGGMGRPIVIEHAVVRVVRAPTVGVQFMQFATGDRARLGQLVRKLLLERHTAA